MWVVSFSVRGWFKNEHSTRGQVNHVGLAEEKGRFVGSNDTRCTQREVLGDNRKIVVVLGNSDYSRNISPPARMSKIVEKNKATICKITLKKCRTLLGMSAQDS